MLASAGLPVHCVRAYRVTGSITAKIEFLLHGDFRLHACVGFLLRGIPFAPFDRARTYIEFLDGKG